MGKKVRIVKRSKLDGSGVEFTIQQKHWLFRWWWVDAWLNDADGANCTDTFGSLEEAKKNLCYFDGSKCVEEVVY